MGILGHKRRPPIFPSLIARAFGGAVVGGIGGVCGGWVVAFWCVGTADVVTIVERGLSVAVVDVLEGMFFATYALAKVKTYRTWTTVSAIAGASVFALIALQSAQRWRMHVWECVVQLSLGVVGGVVTGLVVSAIGKAMIHGLLTYKSR